MGKDVADSNTALAPQKGRVAGSLDSGQRC